MTVVDDPAATRAVTWVVLREVRPRYAGLLPDELVRDHVHRAVRDLRGSINLEALPEMATRLVTVRLGKHMAETGPAPDPPGTDHSG